MKDEHKNAKLTAKSREEMVKRMQSQVASVVAAGFGVSVRTAYKWQKRYREGGIEALCDASSRPKCCKNKLGDKDSTRIVELRKSHLTGSAISARTNISRSSVFRVLRRRGLSRLRSLEVKEPVVRYDWERPGQMLHMDVKKLGKIDGVGHRFAGRKRAKPRHAGWEYLHVCVDSASRIAFAAVMPNEKKESAVDFLKQAVAYYNHLGITVERILTDNGSCYRSCAWRNTCTELNIAHKKTRPYRPQTNGKAKRFIRSAINEWAYARPYNNSAQRTAALALWINWYNMLRAHSSLCGIAPAQWINKSLNNLFDI